MSEAQDEFTMRSAKYLIRFLGKTASPKGETPESVGELIEVHRRALHTMKQRTGKGTVVLEMGMLAKKYPLTEEDMAALDVAMSEASNEAPLLI